MTLFEIKSRWNGSVLCKVIGVKKLDYDAIFPKYEPPKRETALKGGGRE